MPEKSMNARAPSSDGADVPPPSQTVAQEGAGTALTSASLPYRVEGYTRWARLTPGGRWSLGCIRCSRPAEFLREKFRKRKCGESYDLAGFCSVHLPKEVARLRASAAPVPPATVALAAEHTPPDAGISSPKPSPE